MADTMEIIISAIDQASGIFGDIISSAQEMASGITDSVGSASSDFDTISNNVSEFQSAVDNVDSTELESLAEILGMDTAEVERLLQAGADMGSISAGFNEAAAAADELEKEIQEDTDAMIEFGSAGDVMAAQTLMDVANGMKDSMLGAADSAGSFNDSLMRAGLEAQGAGVSVDEMRSIVSNLSDETGRAGGQIRESFIKATARGITDMQSFETMMKGAGAQATLFSTDIETMGNKFSSMAQRNTLMERALSETGITMQELGTAMGMTGATADEVKEKWKELDVNQRAAALGQAASMNEGKNANEEYKNSWAGLQEQVDIARGRLMRMVGSVLLPVLIPAMHLASTVLTDVGNTIDWLMKSPLGGLISILGAAGGAFIIAVAGATALRSMFAFLRLETMLDAAATIFNTGTKILNGEASGGASIANMLLGESFMASAAAAWSAAAGFLAAAWPLLAIVAAIALVVVAVYELGKAFGWWTDFSSMIDAIRAGVMRLWDAFINHPDVQAVIKFLTDAWNGLVSAVTGAWNAVMEFFGISTGGDFDIVRSLIEGIGQAWDFIRQPIVAFIDILQTVFDTVYSILTGHMDLQTGIMNIWNSLVNNVPVILNALFTVYMTIWGSIFNAVMGVVSNIVSGVVSWFSQLPGRIGQWLNNTKVRILAQMIAWVVLARVRARLFVTSIVNGIRNLPGRVYTIVHSVVSRIVSAIQAWINSARSKVHQVVSAMTGPFSGVGSKISNALSGVVNAITAPFRNAWNTVKPYVDKINNAINTIGNILPFGGEPAYGGETAADVTGRSFNINTGEYTVTDEDKPIIIEETINLILDLKNIPSGIDIDSLISAIKDKKVLDALTSNRDFQDMDAKVKQRIQLKNVRARGR